MKPSEKTGRVTKRSKAKKILASTANKIKDVFQNKNNENQFSRLNENDDDEAISIDSNDGVISIDGDEETGFDSESLGAARKRLNLGNEIQLVDSDSEANDMSFDARSVLTAPVPKTNKLKHNELDDNNDFISLKFSDSEESGDEEEENAYDNSDDAYSMDDGESNLFPFKPKVNSDTPWIKDHDHSKQREIIDWLTMEIKDFVAYISPSKEEIELRNSTVRRLKKKIEQFWEDCEVQVFGSYATDLYLPGSDIDMVIVSPNGNYDNRNALYQLSSFLKREKLATNVEVIAKTKVPIIKFTEKRSGIHIDVSFERTNGIEAARVIRGWLEETSGLRELVLIIKQFLNARKLNNVRVGGLGGYSIICLCYSFLTLHPRLSTGNILALENMGVLLIEFFELYGKNFNYDDVAISVEEDNVSYLNKRYYPDLQGRSSFAIAIQDPKDPTNNISRGSFNLRDIRKAFSGAYELLVNTCYDLEVATYKERLGKSILGNVIKYRGSQREFSDDREIAINEVIQLDQQSIVSKKSVLFHEYDTEQDTDKEEGNEKVTKEQKPPRGRVEDYLGLEQSSEDDENDENNEGIPSSKKLKRSTSNSSLSKGDKRDFWVKKGNILA